MSMLAHDSLIVARRILKDIVAADALVRVGQETRGRALLAQIASRAVAELPVINGVLAAQTVPEEGGAETHWTPWGQLPCGHRVASRRSEQAGLVR